MRILYSALVLAFAAWAARAAPDDPVVSIPGKRAVERPSRTTVLSPAIVQVDTAMEVEPTVGVRKPEPAASPTAPPIGAVVAWLKSMTNTPPLTRGWVECNGQVISDEESPYHGTAVPDLNGNRGPPRFLRGSATGGDAGGAEKHSHGSYRSQKYGQQRIPVMVPSPAENLPPYYGVVWIIRIK